jgi:hypothetical protein
MTSPTSIELRLKIATRAQPAAVGLQTIAPGIGNGEPRAIAELAPRACIELTGGWR